jgi:hypothetical protein
VNFDPMKRILLALLGSLLLALPAVVQAQFTFTTTNGTITITGYTGTNAAVTIPSTTNGLPVTSIGDSAFVNDGSLANVTILANVSNIGDYAISDCTNLTNVTLGNSVTSIGGDAFYSCSSLTSVTIPDGVTNIGDYAFIYCSNLKSVTIPSSVHYISDGTFWWCYRLTLYFKGNAPDYNEITYQGFGNPRTYSSYYLPGTTGWIDVLLQRPTVLWLPQVQTSDASFGVRTNQFGFNIAWASGMTVVVEACTNVANPIWSPVSTNTLTSGSSYFSDPQWTNYPARFYRIRSQ